MTADTAQASQRDTAALGLVNRVTWGVSPSALPGADGVGGDRWLDRQLHPGQDIALPPAIQAQIDDLDITKTSMAELVVDMDALNRTIGPMTDVVAKQAARDAFNKKMSGYARQAMIRSVLRDIYAPDQLQEQMVWFWFNHFNVHFPKADIGAMVADYEERAIRPHALGRYRDLLEATLRHPAMLRYLDNDQNAANHINENYAREIMELHSMGVGSGYTQKDVQELARILTGVGVDIKHDNPKLKPAWQPLLVRAGLFEFNPARHDFGDKLFLGHHINGAGFDEVERALDLIANSPATAHHVSTQLASFFVGDAPPAGLVKKMSDTFQHSDGDIAAVLKTMFGSPEFRSSYGRSFKDPVHYAMSAIRASYDGRTIVNPGIVVDWLNRFGEGLYSHQTPDGYPLESAAWAGPGQMFDRFEFSRILGAGQLGLFKSPDPAAKNPPVVPQIRDTSFYEVVKPSLSDQTRTALGQAASPQDWNALFFASPEFMRR